MWWLLWGDAAWKPRMRAAPRPVTRRATRATRPAKRMPQTIASWYPFASGRTMAALPSETIELGGADTFPGEEDVTTTCGIARHLGLTLGDLCKRSRKADR